MGIFWLSVWKQEMGLGKCRVGARGWDILGWKKLKPPPVKTGEKAIDSGNIFLLACDSLCQRKSGKWGKNKWKKPKAIGGS